jgi:hypothetical protein
VSCLSLLFINGHDDINRYCYQYNSIRFTIINPLPLFPVDAEGAQCDAVVNARLTAASGMLYSSYDSLNSEGLEAASLIL